MSLCNLILTEIKINSLTLNSVIFYAYQLKVNLHVIAEAVPKKILDLMNVEGLTRENVASHLQVQVLHSFIL